MNAVQGVDVLCDRRDESEVRGVGVGGVGDGDGDRGSKYKWERVNKENIARLILGVIE